MEKNNTINKLKGVLESSTMTTYLRSLSSDAERLNWLQKALYFLISTRDYDEVFLYLLNSNDLTFPVGYMNNKEILERDIQTIFKRNYLRDGFLYHGTSNVHNNSILEQGLIPLSFRYGQELLDDVIKINLLCKQISLNTLKYTQGKVRLSENMPLDFLNDRINKVFLTADISQAFHYCSLNNNWFRDFIENLILFIGGEASGLYYEEKNTLLNQVITTLNHSKAIISANEKKVFIEKYYNKNEVIAKAVTNSLVIVKNDINLNESFVDVLVNFNDKTRGINYVLNQINYQDIYTSKVAPQDLAILSFNKDQSLSLTIGKKGMF